ncbi:transcriptional regulator [Brevundimonas staleyi]|uniref:Transcriptional regulator n=1 Tax=Brevundimonas staleyi TaxID=74326 RepID=A0ABW0FNL3_9CAUL
MSEADGLFANRVRAGVLAWLSDRGAGDFTELAAALSLANNTLSSHLRRLEEAGFIDLQRGFFGRRPRTRVVMTASGRQAWLDYLDTL